MISIEIFFMEKIYLIEMFGVNVNDYVNLT